MQKGQINFFRAGTASKYSPNPLFTVKKLLIKLSFLQTGSFSREHECGLNLFDWQKSCIMLIHLPKYGAAEKNEIVLPLRKCWEKMNLLFTRIFRLCPLGTVRLWTFSSIFNGTQASNFRNTLLQNKVSVNWNISLNYRLGIMNINVKFDRIMTSYFRLKQ